MSLPEPVQNLINAFARLPGIGPKTASRLAFYLLRAPEDLAGEVANSLCRLKPDTTYCQTCYNITDAGGAECLVSDDRRERSLICVVEEPLDVQALERTGIFGGLYHVLHGALSPIEGIGPENLRVRVLVARVKAGGVYEVILATKMHEEWYSIPEATVSAIAAARARGGRVVAVGTTTLRGLESAAAVGPLRAHAAATRLFIVPGFRFQVVDRLLTNFHLPKSTLLMLVCAFAGTEAIPRAYAHAVGARYRFFSYGDAMLLDRVVPDTVSDTARD